MGFFFFLMLVVPTTLQAERGMLLFLIILGSFTILRTIWSGWVISRQILLWLVICIAYSLFSILWGVINDSQGAIAVSTVYVLWPILFVYFIGFTRTVKPYVFLEKIILIGVFLAALSGVLFVTSSFYPVLRIFDPYFKLMSGSLGLYENSTAFTLSNMATVIYGLPFMTALLMMGPRTSLYFSYKWKVFCVIGLLVSFFVMLIAGRKAFMAVALISVPVTLLLMRIARFANFQYKSFVKISTAALLVAIFGILVGAITLGLDSSTLVAHFLSGFDFNDSSNISATRRAEQFYALMGEWQSSYLIGFGHGSNARSAPGDVVPWAYELQYVALLFQTGILGMLIYGSAVTWLMYQMIRLSRKYADLAVLMLPLLVGLICFLVANATNPYLSKFDYLWTLFLPVGLVNTGLLRVSVEKSLANRLCSHA